MIPAIIAGVARAAPMIARVAGTAGRAASFQGGRAAAGLGASEGTGMARSALGAGRHMMQDAAPAHRAPGAVQQAAGRWADRGMSAYQGIDKMSRTRVGSFAANQAQWAWMSRPREPKQRPGMAGLQQQMDSGSAMLNGQQFR